MINNDALFEAAVNFLEDGGILPDAIAEDPRSAFLAAILRDTHGCVKETHTLAKTNESRIIRIENLLKWIGGAVGIIGTIVGILAGVGIL